jgi:hypothetical protein
MNRPLVLAAIAVLGATASTASAAGGGWRFGARYNVLASNAPPANDMHGYGLTLRRVGANGWSYGAALELYEYDYEEPYKVLDIARPPGTEPIDGSNESTVMSAWIEKESGRRQGWRWFWTAGLGYAFLTVDTVTGPDALGGHFDIRTDAQDELQLMASFGVRRRLAARWNIEVALLGQHHFTDYALRDTISGRTGSIGSQTPIGISFGVSLD